MPPLSLTTNKSELKQVSHFFKQQKLAEKTGHVFASFYLVNSPENARLHFSLCSPGTTNDAACALAGREHQSWFSFAAERAING